MMTFYSRNLTAGCCVDKHSEPGRSERMTRAYRTGISVTSAGYMLKTSRAGSSKNGMTLLRNQLTLCSHWRELTVHVCPYYPMS